MAAIGNEPENSARGEKRSESLGRKIKSSDQRSRKAPEEEEEDSGKRTASTASMLTPVFSTLFLTQFHKFT